MSTDRVKIITDPRHAALQAELDKVDWNKFVRYGYVRIKVRDGDPKVQTIEETFPEK